MTLKATLALSPADPGRATCELLVGSQAFWARAEADMAAARRRLLVQAMTFEGDASGQAVAKAIARCPAPDRRVLVDSYSRFFISDRMVVSPAYLLDRPFREEVKATFAMFRSLAAGGVGVRATNPFGPLYTGRPFRNHKKIIVADDVAYVGGINFSDHNFEWPDLMLRIEGPAADLLAQDFEWTYRGEGRAWTADAGEVRLFGLDGRTNPSAFAPLVELIAGASRSVFVISPYFSFPFLEALGRAAAGGAEVTLVTPMANNKPFIRDYLSWAAPRLGIQVRLVPHMIHLKGILVDEATLIVGSANFDFVSYRAEEEIVAVVSDPQVCNAFEREVAQPALAASSPPLRLPLSALKGRLSLAALKTVDAAIGALGWDRRTAVDWRY